MVDEIRTDLQPPLSGAGRRKRRRRRVTSGALTVVVLVLLGWGAWFGVRPLINKCYGDDVWSGVDGECVGVTDGGTEFPGLEPIEAKIKYENDRVSANPRVVTVGVLVPVPIAGKPNSASLSQIRSQLEGSYLKQHQANSVREDRPIKLVVANEGSSEQDWSQVVDRLDEMAQEQQPLNAVAGLGVSVQQTVDGARRLAGHGLPMVGSVLTSDNLNANVSPPPGGPIRSLYRVSVSNDDEVAALRQEQDKTSPGYQPKAMLVYNDDPQDFYTAGLRHDFETRFSKEIASGLKRPYAGRTPEAISGQFNVISDDLCKSEAPDTVLYAGRADLLGNFVNSLMPKEVCGHQVTVLTGSDAGSLDRSQIPPGVTVKYAALAAPAALRGRSTNEDSTYSKFEEAFQNRESNFPASDLDNGWAIMGYDSMKAIDEAVRYVPGGGPLIPQAVLGNLGSFTSEDHKVDGASGTFYFDQLTHTPVGQDVDVLQLGHGEGEDQPRSVYKP